MEEQIKKLGKSIEELHNHIIAVGQNAPISFALLTQLDIAVHEVKIDYLKLRLLLEKKC